MLTRKRSSPPPHDHDRQPQTLLLLLLLLRVMNLVYASLGVLLFSGLLIYDTQLVVGGKNRKYQLGPDDYIFGALSLYLDIINMFLFILTIVGNSR